MKTAQHRADIGRDSLRKFIPHIELSLRHRGVSTTRLPGPNVFEPLLMLPAKSRGKIHSCQHRIFYVMQTSSVKQSAMPFYPTSSPIEWINDARAAKTFSISQSLSPRTYSRPAIFSAIQYALAEAQTLRISCRWIE